jgi:hypothetical protein
LSNILPTQFETVDLSSLFKAFGVVTIFLGVSIFSIKCFGVISFSTGVSYTVVISSFDLIKKSKIGLLLTP